MGSELSGLIRRTLMPADAARLANKRAREKGAEKAGGKKLKTKWAAEVAEWEAK